MRIRFLELSSILTVLGIAGLFFLGLHRVVSSGPSARAPSSEREGAASLLSRSADVLSGTANLTLCFPQADSEKLKELVDNTKTRFPEAVFQQKITDDTCVEPREITDKDLTNEWVRTMDRAPRVEVSVAKVFGKVQLDGTEEVKPAIVTLKAAGIGLLTAYGTRVARPGIDALSNKGGGENITLTEGALVAAVTAAYMQAKGETNERRILTQSFINTTLAGLIKTKDPNVLGVALIYSVAQIPWVQQKTREFSDSHSAELDWKLPLLATGAAVALSRLQKSDPLVASREKLIQVGSYGALAAAVTLSTGNETTGFAAAALTTAFDEASDRFIKGARGHASWSDVATNLTGAYLGAKTAGKSYRLYLDRKRDSTPYGAKNTQTFVNLHLFGDFL